MERWLLDTNVIIDLLAPDQAPDDEVRGRVRDLFERAAQGEVTLVVTPVVVFETLLVLSGFDLPPREAAGLIEQVLTLPGVECEDEEHVLYALSRYSRKLDFVDGYLASRSQAEPYRVVSNDRHLKRLPSRRGRCRSRGRSSLQSLVEILWQMAMTESENVGEGTVATIHDPKVGPSTFRRSTLEGMPAPAV